MILGDYWLMIIPCDGLCKVDWNLWWDYKHISGWLGFSLWLEITENMVGCRSLGSFAWKISISGSYCWEQNPNFFFHFIYKCQVSRASAGPPTTI